MWIDELAAMPRAQEVFDMATMGCRLGNSPQAVLTTTPRPTPIIKWLLADDLTVQTRASTFDNPHLPDTFKHQIMKKYQGTRLGRQDVEGALWTLGMIEALRVKEPPPMVRIVVAVDPPASSKSTGAEAGIVVCGIAANGHKYVLDDVSLRATPAEWGKQAVLAYDSHKADRIIIEVNQGGEMASQVLTSAAIELHRQGKRQSKHIPISTVYASRGKRARAEPIAALYEQGLIHHCGVFEALEEQMCTWVAGSGDASPDRIDACVYALTALQGAVSDASGYNVSLQGSASGISQQSTFSAYATPF
jgi:predicted phage terminase large subunit-like protein